MKRRRRGGRRRKPDGKFVLVVGLGLLSLYQATATRKRVEKEIEATKSKARQVAAAVKDTARELFGELWDEAKEMALEAVVQRTFAGPAKKVLKGGQKLLP